MTDEVKTCTKCGATKPLGEFYRHGPSKDGRCPRCRSCLKVDRRQRYLANDGLAKVREANWARYGITSTDYERMLIEQGGGCATCGAPPPPDRAFHVDHCHETGVVRGLLCHGCNIAIGGAHDRPDVLRACADYLERAKGGINAALTYQGQGGTLYP